MNEGDSAGGGHQGPSPAPPAVPIRRPNLTITTSSTNINTGNVSPNVVASSSSGGGTSNTSNINIIGDINQTITPPTPTILSIVTTNATLANSNLTASTIFSDQKTTTGTGTGTTTTTQTAINPRSFQQAFTQHQQHKQQPQQQQQNSENTSNKNNNSSANITTAVGLQTLHMPQNSASTNLTAVGAATATAAGVADNNTITSQQQTHPQQRLATDIVATRSLITPHITASDSPPPLKRPKFESSNSSLTETDLVSCIVNVVGSLLPATTTGSSSDQQKSSATNIVAVAASLSAPATSTTTTTPQDFQALKKRVLENKYLRLRSLKEKHNENVAELFYLQSGGNMMEYPTWRKKPPTQQLMSFNNAYRLNQLVGSTESVEDAATSSSHSSGSNISSSISVHNQQQQPTAENIATIIGVASSSVPQQQQQQQQQPPIDNATAKGVPTNQSIVTTTSDAATSSTAASITIKPTLQVNTIPASSYSTVSDASSLPQGAEIKIPAVGATPVAVSTKLPAAVVQLSQQGHIPGRPLGGRHGMVFGQISTLHAVGNTSSVPLVPGGTPLVPATVGGTATLRRNGQSTTSSSAGITVGATTTNTTPPPLYTPAHASALLRPASANGTGPTGSGTGSSAQEFSFKAKQEVYVMQRISELQREGLWTEKRLPKLQEPSRPKAHWDYLLEEMVWLATDFAQERKWKKNAAKKCARMVQKYFQDKANAAQKAEKAQEAHQRRVAAFIAKEIKYFWSNVEKLVEYKHHTKLEEKRKKALDQHLCFIVDQTEKFSQQLAEGMNKNIAADASAATSVNASRRSSPKPEDVSMSDDDFRPDTGSEDDEETIAKAEKEEETNVKDEVAALEKESQMEFDDFLNDLPAGYLENREKLMKEEENRASNKESNDAGENEIDDEDDEDDVKNKEATSSKQLKRAKTTAKDTKVGDKENDDENDTEFEANEASEDDENTLIKQEAEEMDVDHKKEIDELEADNDLTVEELLKKYKTGKIDESKTTKSTDKRKSAKALDSDNDEDDEEEAMAVDSDDLTDVDEGSSTEDSDEVEESDDETATEAEGQEKEDGAGLKSLLEDETYAGNNKDDMIKDAAALAESIQPKGNTLSSTDVVTPVPFLLKHTLREYQHIGLDWLVTMNERKLNGILADEMGLGKTIQTIALLAHLACVKGNWGPHLIVVPSSVMLNWEMEFKKWCPGFKILTYYGTQKERKMKRVGWTKPNAFHVCITSYKLVVQDQQSFRRKKWKYLILDEAQNIKNFKSQRWQLLLNFSTERRLLLTGTPLQNDLMELWSLMHFLMPYVFSSHREFKEWFSNPMTGMIEGNMEYNETLISRLHKVIRPFLLRRLKKEVEKQMPKKYEHVVMCRLSNRQRYLYDDFMSRAKTKETLQTGNLLSVINVLMQLRKVCNHPNMFEVRPTISPFQMEGITFQTPRLVCDLLEYDPFTQVDLSTLNLLLIELELSLTAYASYRSQKLGAPRQLIEEIDSLPQLPPPCPTGKFKFHIRVRDSEMQQHISQHHANSVRVGASPAMKVEGNQLLPVHSNVMESKLNKRMQNINPVNMLMRPKLIEVIATNNTTAAGTSPKTTTSTTVSITSMHSSPTPAKIARLMPSSSSSSGTGSVKPFVMLTSTSSNAATISTLNSELQNRKSTNTAATYRKSDNPALLATIAKEIKTTNELKDSIKMEVDNESEATPAAASNKNKDDDDDAASALDPIYNMSEILKRRKEARIARLKLIAEVNRRRLEAVPIYGDDCRNSLAKVGSTPNQTLRHTSWQSRGYLNCQTAMSLRDGWTLGRTLKSYEQRCSELRQTFANFVIYVPSTCAPCIRFHAQHLSSTRLQREQLIERTLTQKMSPKLTLLHPIISAMTTQFPDPRLIQYDCGKLQTLDRLLRQLKSEQHRVLIFTQMTKMLDVLEAFLNHHGHIYLRLDGSTRVEQRQVLMERFNGDKRIFCFILSTRSGGVGVNLTGADTVIFYDSDWNPTMDAQAQDRCHRIGQTRDVHIYRLVSEKTIEVNILKKANQKRMLSDMAIEGGNFTTTYFKSSTIKDLFNVEINEQDQQQQQQQSVAAAATTDAQASSTLAIEKPATSKQSSTGESILTAEVSNAATVLGSGVEIDAEKQTLRVFESALAAAEDEQDVQATKTAKAEAAADLAEFDETIPLDETTTDGGGVAATGNVELSRADLEMQNLVKQLSPIERYAMRFVEETGAAWTAEQLRAAEEEIEAQKREWEANRLAAMQKEEEMLKQEADADDMLTYSRKDAGINQVNKNSRKKPNIINKKTLNRRRRQLVGMARRQNRNLARKNKQTNRQKISQEHDDTEIVAEQKPKTATTINRNRNKRDRNRSSVKQETEDNYIDISIKKPMLATRRLSRGNNGIVRKANTLTAATTTTAMSAREALTTASNLIPNPSRKTTRASIAAAVNQKDDKMAEELSKAAEDSKTDISDTEVAEPTSKPRVTRKNSISGLQATQTSSKTGVRNQKLLKIAANRRANISRSRTVSGCAENVVLSPAKVRKLSLRVNKFDDAKNAPRRQLRSSPNKKDVEARELKTDSDSEHEGEEQPKRKTPAKRIAKPAATARRAVINAKKLSKSMSREEHEDNSMTSDDNSSGSESARASKHNKRAVEHEAESAHSSYETAVSENEIEDNMTATTHENDENGDNEDSDHDSDEANANYSSNNDDDNGGDDTDDDNEDDEDKHLNQNSLDEAWNAHAQLNDTTNATNSTYYNVSEESDSEDNETLAQMTTSARGTSTATKTKQHLMNRRNSTVSPAAKQMTNSSLNCIDVNSPRTRSRGSVKINLWTLDVSPVLPTISRKPKSATASIASEKHIDEQEESLETVSKTQSKSVIDEDEISTTKSSSVKQNVSTTPVRTSSSSSSNQKSGHLATKRVCKRLGSTTSKSLDEIAGSKQPVVTLHRWLLKTPRTNSSTTTTLSATSANAATSASIALVNGGDGGEDSDDTSLSAAANESNINALRTTTTATTSNGNLLTTSSTS